MTVLQKTLHQVLHPSYVQGYDNSKTTIGKLSARRIQICFDYF